MSFGQLAYLGLAIAGFGLFALLLLAAWVAERRGAEAKPAAGRAPPRARTRIARRPSPRRDEFTSAG